MAQARRIGPGGQRARSAKWINIRRLINELARETRDVTTLMIEDARTVWCRRKR